MFSRPRHFACLSIAFFFVVVILGQYVGAYPALADSWCCNYDVDGTEQNSFIPGGDNMLETDRQAACQLFCTKQQSSTPPTACKSAPTVTQGCLPTRFVSKFSKLSSPISGTTIPQIIGKIIKQVLAIVGALTFLVFFYGGVLWMTSAGNEDRVKQGTQAMTWAVIGLLIIFFSYAVLTTFFRLTTGG